VKVLAFAVDQLAEPARIVDLPHRVQVGMIARRLEHHVIQARRLDRLEQPVGVFQMLPEGRHRRAHVLAVTEHLDAVATVTGGVGGHEDRFDRVVFDHFFQRRIGLVALAHFGQRPAAVRKQIADRHHLGVRVILQRKRRAEFADAIADDPHAELAVGDGLPRSRRLGSRLGFLETLDFRFAGRRRCRPSQGRGPQTGTFQERTS
jgi:hypothetical protein